METLNNLDIEGEEENISEENSEDELDYKWKIKYENEIIFWTKTVLPELVYNPTLCPKCKKNTYRVYEKTKKDLINPFYLKCIIPSCQKRENIKKYSILKCAKTIPASIIFNKIQYFIIEKKNAKDIEKILKDSYQCVPNYSTITKEIDNVKFCIAEYLKYAYKIVQIGGDPEANRTVAIDETLITHKDGKQVWIVGAIDTTTKNVRLDYLPERNGHNLKIFVNNHILPGTNLTHDGWQGYNFLDNEDSVWTHETHNHGYRDFGFGSHSTSHIEAFFRLN